MKAFHSTGLYVDIEGAASGPKRSIAVRGDIDALPIQEAREDLPYRSQVNGVMHACGHDVHASIALGTALDFHRMRDILREGCVYSSSRPRRRSRSANVL
ncbi:metal-dependent amidase/aminoacylase/carboxypeptidase family protein [Bradyrhizobium japonicum]